MQKYLFLDNASTTRCCEAAATLVQQFAVQDFGNPSSTHAYGQQASRAIADARAFFAGVFEVKPTQIVFTGSGTEADNLAVHGIAMDVLAKRIKSGNFTGPKPRILCSKMEHAAVKKTVQSMADLGFEADLIPVDQGGQIHLSELEKLLTPNTVLVSIHQVNNIVGTVIPVEEIARFCKERVPGLIFHTDAVQSFGKVETPKSPDSPVDLVSVSGHKVHGPKGVGALIILNERLLKEGFRPLVWGGDQEGGWRSGTQNAGLIAGFHAAAQETLSHRKENQASIARLQARFREMLIEKNLLATHGAPKGKFHWNSPGNAIPQIVNLSFPGYPAALMAKMLEERGCLVSTGSACSSGKAAPDATLCAMGYPHEICASAIRISFASTTHQDEINHLIQAMDESVKMLTSLLG